MNGIAVSAIRELTIRWPEGLLWHAFAANVGRRSDRNRRHPSGVAL